MVDVLEGPPLRLKGGDWRKCVGIGLRSHECGHQWAITPIHQNPRDIWQPTTLIFQPMHSLTYLTCTNDSLIYAKTEILTSTLIRFVHMRFLYVVG